MVNIGNSWDRLLADEFKKDYYLKLRSFLIDEYQTYRIYPDKNAIFNALKYTDYPEVRVVILGQDPYHGPNQAHGLCFSVQKGIIKPPSLVNIFKELKSELGIDAPAHGSLEEWAKRGVLLLNTVLTVREGEANSHKGKGWEILTDRIIEILNDRDDPMVFMLWGANAKTKQALITNGKHLTLTSAHPSPLSAHNGFFGNGHFTKANAFLAQTGREIDWKIK